MPERPEVIDPSPEDQPIALSHVAATLRRYRMVIALAMASVILATAIVAAAAYIFSYSQKIASVPFLLEFNGANVGQYPNGLKFSVADVTANPVLTESYAANGLNQFVAFDQFSRSVYVLESNRALDQLGAEYQAKLADPKLTPVDRERLEREFDSKVASINKSAYAIQFLINDQTKAIPRTLVTKTLNDILAIWARRAAIEKKALDIQVPVLSSRILDDAEVDGSNYLIPLLVLRRRVDDVVRNLDAIAKIPGAELVRTTKDNASLEELRLRVDELARLRIEPLIGAARATDQTGSAVAAKRVLQTQLDYDQRILNSARMREDALRNSLLTYDAQNSTTTATSAGQTATPATSNNPLVRPSGEAVMPQLSESFLDRIVDLTKNDADRAYRQKLNDDIKKASLDVIPLEQAVRYDKELLHAFEQPAQSDGMSAQALTREWQNVLADARRILVQMNEIYQLASRQLNPSTELYRVTAPPTFTTERATSLPRIFLMSVLAILVAFPIVIVGVLVHNRIREEEAMEQHAREAAEAVAS